MDMLTSIRDDLTRIYGEHDTLIRFLLKFFMALITFVMINLVLGQMHIVNNPIIVLALALISAFLPSNSMILIGMIMILIHFYGISLEAALAGGGMLVIIMLLYFSVAPRTAFPLIFGAIGAGLHLPGVIAVLFGLISGPLSAIGVGFGVMICYLMKIVSSHGTGLSATSTDAADALIEKMLMLITLVLETKEMFLVAAVSVLVIWVVCAIRQIPGKFVWMISASTGIVLWISGLMVGQYILGISVNYIQLGAEIGAGLILAWMTQIFLYNLDFKKTETVRFEDDEYYYFVKAVPKRKIQNRRSRR